MRFSVLTTAAAARTEICAPGMHNSVRAQPATASTEKRTPYASPLNAAVDVRRLWQGDEVVDA
jgi:hypothetical protein